MELLGIYWGTSQKFIVFLEFYKYTIQKQNKIKNNNAKTNYFSYVFKDL